MSKHLISLKLIVFCIFYKEYLGVVMKYMDEYRNLQGATRLAAIIAQTATRRWNIMEVCGGQTNAIMKYGIEGMLPEFISLLHGPGCPVCVTHPEKIDTAIQIALKGAILASFGDMIRVPGSSSSLIGARAAGADIRIVYSPLDTLKIAIENESRQVVFFAVGFETTAPSVARTIIEAKKRRLHNFSVIVSHVLIPPAMEFLLSKLNTSVDAFLAPGHVCTVMGYGEYDNLCENYFVPIVVTGFEPSDILSGILMAVRQLEQGMHNVENQYSRAVTKGGNQAAQNLMMDVFYKTDYSWRGIGSIPMSGLSLNPDYSEFDAITRFSIEPVNSTLETACISGEVLSGIKKPVECMAFGKECSPDHPLGAPMVSSEGVCSAFFHYSKRIRLGKTI